MTPKEFSDFNRTFGPLRKIFPQKKFDDPKMAGEFFFATICQGKVGAFLRSEKILDDGSVRITMKMESKHIDGHRRVVIPAPGAERLKQTSLLRAINNARLWMDKLINGGAANVTDLSKQLGLKSGYVTRILSLNSLAPDIVEAILAGIEPDGLSIAKLTEQPIPEDWNEQRRLYGFPMR